MLLSLFDVSKTFFR